MKTKKLIALLTVISTSCIPLAGGGIVVKAFDDGAPMVRVQKGLFVMGSNTGSADERPEHLVMLETFWIDRYEVTNARYAECVKAGKCRENEKYDGFGAPEQPAVGVSWFDASDYCAYVAKRLPTEAEWEKAARGAEGREYPWGNGLDCVHANYRECLRSSTAPVGSYPSGISPAGAFDLAGNASEWVQDWYDPAYYAGSLKENPTGPESGKYRVIRGGMWLRFAYQMRSADRAAQSPQTRNNATGFRCVREK